jgi:class 3 adenylate cyclase/HEAT repeat protein
MNATMEGREKSNPVRLTIVGLVLSIGVAIGLGLYKGRLLDQFAQKSYEVVKSRHSKVISLFQSSFYFYLEEQFIPGIKQNMTSASPPIERLVIFSNNGSMLYDTRGTDPKISQDPEIVKRLKLNEPSVLINGFDVQIFMPSNQYLVLYGFKGYFVLVKIATIFGAAVISLILILWAYQNSWLDRFKPALELTSRKIWGLRSKFLATIVLINLITAWIVFYTLTTMQSHEQTRKIEKDSVLFSQYSTAEVISSFTNFFYFYYNERFLPGIRKVISSNEDLLGIRIISSKNKSILFDSDQPPLSSPTTQLVDLPRVEFAPEVEAELKTHDLVVRETERGGSKLLSIINTYRNENQEALFWVEYLFSYQSLMKNIQAIKNQILIDLVPSLIIGLFIAAAFAQILLSPIKKLVSGVQKIAAGNFDVSVDLKKSDEVGELVSAFNNMAAELRKKKELRKYLSDSTYRQIMESVETDGGKRLLGSRVSATILFSDIRNFVSLCESMDAEEVTSLLNDYFTEMVDVVYKHGGEVDKFIGDALLAVFYPTITLATGQVSGDTTAVQAIYCSLEMREKLAEFNARRAALKKQTIETGIGITHGEVISGPIGAKDRMDFTVIGDVVNLASRIEKMSKQGKHTKIVFSQHIEQKVQGLLDYEQISADIKGKEEIVNVFELVGIRDFRLLVQNLKGSDPKLKGRSIELLGLSRNLQAIPHLIESLNDADADIRLKSVVALTRLSKRDDEKVVKAVFERLKAELSEKVITTLISAAGKLCGTEKIFDLAPFLEHADDRIVANAVEALGQAKLPQSVDFILPKLSSKNNRIKANAAMALFAMGKLEVLGVLKPMLMHSDALMRSSAAFALGELTYLTPDEVLLRTMKSKFHLVRPFLADLQETVPMLIALLKDSDMTVRRQAVIALGKIKDRSAVLPIVDSIDTDPRAKEFVQDITRALREIGSHKLVKEVIEKLT